MKKITKWMTASLILVGLVACQPSVPETAPELPTSPEALFQSLRYVAVRKDVTHLKQIHTTYPNIVFSNAFWCAYMAKSLDLQLTPEEATLFGVEDLVKEYDNFNSSRLPQMETANYNLDQATKTFQANLFRLTKGFNAEAWKKMKILSKEETVQAGRPLVQMGLGVAKDKQLMVLSCMPLPGKGEKKQWVIVTIQMTVNKNGLMR